MSANPHNASLGSPDSELPGNESLGNESSVGSTVRFSAAPTLNSSTAYSHGHEALQALLAFSCLHEQLRQRRALEKSGVPLDADVWQLEQFVLDEVLQLIAERALTLTGADGMAVAMAEDNAIVCRAAAGTIVPETGARLDPQSGFSGACLRTGGVVRCDDTETDPRVNVQVCRSLGARSIVAVPIASSFGTIGLLEAFSVEPHGFNDSDVRSLNLLAELILAAMKPEEENRLAEISQRLVAGDEIGLPGFQDTRHAAATFRSNTTNHDLPAATENGGTISRVRKEAEVDRHPYSDSSVGSSGFGIGSRRVVEVPPLPSGKTANAHGGSNPITYRESVARAINKCASGGEASRPGTARAVSRRRLLFHPRRKGFHTNPGDRDLARFVG
jgi:hypothetical protein